MSNETPQQRWLRELSEARKALDERFEEGTRERYEVFRRVNMALPVPPQHVVDERTYLQWVMQECLSMYAEGTEIGKAVAVRSFEKFLESNPLTQKYIRHDISPSMYVARPAQNGADVFHLAMLQYLGLA